VSELTRQSTHDPLVTAPAKRSRGWEAGCAVRRDWPDGTHELVGFRTSRPAADRFLRSDLRFWRRGPLQPLAWTVVVVSRRDFDLHAKRRECRSPDCPTAADLPTAS
jgi:hypothetical protein